MPDDIDDENEEPTTPPRENIKDIRVKLEQANKLNRELSQRLLIHDAGLSELNARQVRAVLASFTPDETVDKDTLKVAAKELGFVQEKVEPPPGTPAPDPNSPNGQNTDPANGATPPTDPVAESITGLSQQELAQVMAMRGGGALTTQEEFNRKLSEAPNAAAAAAVVSQFGAGLGILLEDDLQ